MPRIVLAALLLAPALALAQPANVIHKSELALGEDEQLYSCKSRTGEVAVSFKPEIEVRELLAWVMGFTCKNFVLDPRIVSTAKKVTIIAPNKMTASEAYRVFLVALSTINYTIVPKGKIVKVVESATAKRETVPIYKNGLPDGNDQIVRYVYRPTYAQADSLVQAWTALKSDAGDVQLVGSMLLVTDYASHVKDMLSLGKLIDVPKGADGIYLIPIRHAEAAKLSEKVSVILGMQGNAPAPTRDPKAPAAPVALAVPSKIIVDERTNTLIVAASEGGYNRVNALVERLDIPLDIEGGSAFHVYRLGSGIAEELAKTLNDALGQNRPTPKPGAPASAPTDSIGTAIEGQVRIIGDKPTNSLLVMSSGRDFLAIKEVIRQLDVPRRQVYIEAMILDVSINSNHTLGTAMHGGMPGTNGSLFIGGVQMPDLQTMDLTRLAATGLIGGLIGKELEGSRSLFGKSIPSYALLFNAVAGGANTNIISTPIIIGVDNEESKQKVGINIPYSKGSSQGVGVAGTPFQTENFDRRDLLVELSIKPHISIDDTVLLEIKHDAEDLFGESAGQPTWTKRSLETRVVVRNQQTVVVGGMMQERDQVTTSKVPLLGDIPILGYLFKYKRKEKRKTNLLIMLTPYIIKDQMDLQLIHERKTREHQEFVSSFKSLDGAKYNPKVDYARKRGLVEEINRTLISIDEDARARETIRTPPRVVPGPIEYSPDAPAKP
jgi:general secretion pathway protein D